MKGWKFFPNGFNLRFFNTKGAGGFNPCIETDFSIPMEQAVLTPVFSSIPASEKRNILFHKSLILLSYMVISRKAEKTDQIYIHAKTAKKPISR